MIKFSLHHVIETTTFLIVQNKISFILFHLYFIYHLHIVFVCWVSQKIFELIPSIILFYF